MRLTVFQGLGFRVTVFQTWVAFKLWFSWCTASRFFLLTSRRGVESSPHPDPEACNERSNLES